MSFKKMPFVVLFAMITSFSVAQTTYDSKTLVDTNSSSTSTSTVNTNNTSTATTVNTNNTNVNSVSTNVNTSNSVNTNNNVNTGTMTYNNNNVNASTSTSTNVNTNNNVNSGTINYNNNNVNASTSTSVNTNNNVNTGTMTNNNNNVNTNTSASTSTSVNTNNNVNSGDMTNRNINTSSATSSSTNNNVNQNIQSGSMVNRNLNQSEVIQKVVQAPPTAVAPTMMSGGNSDLCTTGTSSAVQTQIFGVSSGGTVRDENCERLKLSKTLYDMGMKVAAVATMCQDRRVWDAMMAAGTPCPYEGKIGEQAKEMWIANPGKVPAEVKAKGDDTYKKIGIGSLLGVVAYKLFGIR
jgi:hypothetical protein